jgi:pullulanase
MKWTKGIFFLAPWLLAMTAMAGAPDYHDIRESRAFWASSETILVPQEKPTARAHWSLAQTSEDGTRILHEWPLPGRGSFDATYREFSKFSFLAGYVALDASAVRTFAPELLKQGFLYAIAREGDQVIDATHLQAYGLLDELFAWEGPLGVTFHGAVPSFRLWAPTARSVTLLVYDQARDAAPSFRIPMQAAERGTWQTTGDAAWRGKFYVYEVTVVSPALGLQTSLVTDPYSVSVSAGAQWSEIADLNSDELKPEGWDHLRKPPLRSFRDVVLYELHVRDFSAYENRLGEHEDYRKRFLAFTVDGTDGNRHLQRLAAAGLTHVHLLPVTEFNPTNGDGAYNWGYEPTHYFVPEESYATSAAARGRVREMRAMIAALSHHGLRTVMDVAFNHTGQTVLPVVSPFAVNHPLDRIVPGYYYRLDLTGRVQKSSCCADTASERTMMERLIVDAVVHWARQYKVDGFRFDLMGFHTRANLIKVRQALDALTPARDGVDGKSIYIYGEGWTFGSLVDRFPRDACTQFNCAGLGIGMFNDRLRDRVRGGNFLSESLTEQGYATGLYHDFNGLRERPYLRDEPSLRHEMRIPWDRHAQRDLLTDYAQVIRQGLAGNLQGLPFADERLRYHDQPIAFAIDPVETINYVSAHDNLTLWDNIAAKAPFQTSGRMPATASITDRVRMQELALALVALGEGVPFFHAGCEFLRTKSGNDNSYDSGDAYNRLDFSMTWQGFGAGLPLVDGNREEADIWVPRFAATQLHARPEDLRESERFFEALLRIRRHSPWLHLDSAQIQQYLQFLDLPVRQGDGTGVIAMHLGEAAGASQLAPPAAGDESERLLVIFNPSPAPLILDGGPLLRGHKFRLHPELAAFPHIASVARWRARDGTFRVPGRAATVFTEARELQP